ncbi:MAG: hypothetical protein ACREP9_00195, partial [Candidatus Dormibacteraceae bacterium]
MSDPFSEVIGHHRIVDFFRQQLAHATLSHAYLLVGEPQLGKTTVARALARTLLPQMALEQHPDYWEDDRAESLKLDELRLLPDHQPEFHVQSLQAFLSLKPSLGQVRVALITNLARLATPLQAVLLKTLEEPHPGRVIILTAPSLSPFVVLPTVISRCQQVTFHSLPSSSIAEFLVAAGASRESSRELAELARGRPGWALSAFTDQPLLEGYRQWTVRLSEVFGTSAVVALHTAAELDRATRQRADRGTSSVAKGKENSAFNLGLVLISWQLELRRRMIEAVDSPAAVQWAVLLERSYQ